MVSYSFWQEEFDHFRCLCYHQVDVFILCFSVVNPVSFHNITSKWIPQIRAFSPASPIILVGTQSDLRYDVNILINLNQLRVKPVVISQARGLAGRIRAHDYVECSALTQKNLKEAFDSAIFAAIKHKKQKHKKAKKLKLQDCAKTLSRDGWKKLFCFIWPPQHRAEHRLVLNTMHAVAAFWINTNNNILVGIMHHENRGKADSQLC